MNKLIVCNMKMNLNKQEIDSYINKLQNQNLSNVIFCPTSIYIPYFIKNNLKTGIQDISKYESGAYTGQISAKQVASLNVKYSIIGHSETHNNLEEINEKISLCSKYGITPILCIGEKEKVAIEQTKQILEQQLDVILKNNNINKIIIAYEPVWMIGTNESFNTDTLHQIVNFLKNLVQKYNIDDIMILYGGSVNKFNIDDLLSVGDLDGVLVGGACINIDHLLEIIEVTKKK